VPGQRERTGVITGATTGLGFEVARALAERGAAVVLVCRDPARAAGAADRIRATTPKSKGRGEPVGGDGHLAFVPGPAGAIGEGGVGCAVDVFDGSRCFPRPRGTPRPGSGAGRCGARRRRTLGSAPGKSSVTSANSANGSPAGSCITSPPTRTTRLLPGRRPATLLLAPSTRSRQPDLGWTQTFGANPAATAPAATTDATTTRRPRAGRGGKLPDGPQQLGRPPSACSRRNRG
jgi:short subunit dehydrogenase